MRPRFQEASKAIPRASSHSYCGMGRPAAKTHVSQNRDGLRRCGSFDITAVTVASVWSYAFLGQLQALVSSTDANNKPVQVLGHSQSHILQAKAVQSTKYSYTYTDDGLRKAGVRLPFVLPPFGLYSAETRVDFFS